MKIKDLLNRANEEIFVRGEDYYKNDYISFLTYNPQKYTYYGEVEGTGFKDYKIKIELDENNNIDYYNCNCPYDWGDVCKHLVAVCLAIKDGKHIESCEKHIGSNKNISKIEEYEDEEEDMLYLINKASKEDLTKFIIENGFKYGDFQTDLYRFLKKPAVDEEIKFLVGDIESIISDASYFKFDDDPYYYQDETDKYTNDLEKVLKQSKKSLNTDRYMVPFHIPIEIINGVNSLYEFSFESYSLDGLVHDTFEVLKGACDLIKTYGTGAEKENTFKFLIKNSQKDFISTEYNYDFINETLKFVDKSNKKEIYNAIDNIGGNEFYYYENMILKSKIIEIVDGKGESKKFKRDNTQIDEFAIELIEESINNKDLKFCEKLALKKLNEDKGTINQEKWEKILHDIYKSFEIISKQIEIGTNLLKKGNSEYYYILKNLYENMGLLEEKQNEIIINLIENSDFSYYGPILKEEEQWELLWEKVNEHPSNIFEYGPYLVKIYKEDVYEFYYNTLINQGETANNRKEYKLFVNDLRKLYNLGTEGDKYADRVFDYFRKNYKIRRAMQDELNVLNSRRNRN
ncbi:MAG: SWIM zinc finger family protein [Methanobacteriaceae archaeon]